MALLAQTLTDNKRLNHLCVKIISVIENNLYKVLHVREERVKNVLKTSTRNVETKCQVIQI